MEDNESNQGMSGLCKAGCGFYGNSSNDGLCSLCFKNKLRKSLQFQDAQANANSHPTSSSSHPDNSKESSSDSNTEACDNIKDQIQVSGATASNYLDVSNSKDDTLLSSSSSTLSSSNLQSPSHPSSTSSFSTSNLCDIKKDLTKEFEDKLDEKVSEKIQNLNIDDDKSANAVEDGDANSLGNKDKKKNRCHVCKKKVGLTGFGCRCGGLFCGLHRYSDIHKCTYDYKEQGQKEILKNNPRVAYEKITKI